MSYIGRDGTVYQGQEPWGLSKIFKMCNGVINVILAFFITLIPGLRERTPSSIQNGGWGRGPRAPPPPGPRRRNVRGFGSVSDIQPPPCGAGGG